MTPSPAAKSRPVYSFVIPIHNEREALPELHDRLIPVLAQLDGESEVILVDDGSHDSSWAVMLAIRDADRRYKLIRLSRNFGHQAAITAGMDLAEGDAVVIMDADLQDPPEVALEMAARWREGYEVIYGVREDRAVDSVVKRATATIFYRFLSRLTEVDIPENVGDFRLIDRRAVEAFRAMREGGRFVRGMYSWVGFRQIGVPYVREARCAGHTKYPMKKMVRLAVDAVTSFSQVPLRLALKVGAFFSLLAIVGWSYHRRCSPGWRLHRSRLDIDPGGCVPAGRAAVGVSGRDRPVCGPHLRRDVGPPAVYRQSAGWRGGAHPASPARCHCAPHHGRVPPGRPGRLPDRGRVLTPNPEGNTSS